MIIGISSKKGGGKDTAYQMIYNQDPLKFWENRKFADPLKDTVCIILNCSREKLEDREFKKLPLGKEWWYYKIDGKMIPFNTYKGNEKQNLVKLTPRKLLQLLGTEAGRQIIHPNIWINSLFSEYRPSKSNWIITDLRFPNEAKAIQNRGGFLMRINRPHNQEDPHKSEVALDNWEEWDAVIENNGTLEQFEDRVIAQYKKLLNSN